jgi:hypothetical protein
VAVRGPLAPRTPGGAAAAAAGASLPGAVPAAAPGGARGREEPTAFAGLEGVSWSEETDGLRVVLALEGTLPAGAVRRFRPPQDPPREVIQMLGARHGYPRPVVPVNSPLLAQIRVGFHPGAGDELRVVFDLGSPAVVVRSMHNDGRSLRLLLARDDPPAGSGANPRSSAADAALAPAGVGAEPVRTEPPAAPTGAAALPNTSPQ